MPSRIALTRPVSASFARCELTYLEREPIDLERARRQHGGYETLLASLGLTIVRLPALDEQPDAAFVEDAAVATCTRLICQSFGRRRADRLV